MKSKQMYKKEIPWEAIVFTFISIFLIAVFSAPFIIGHFITQNLQKQVLLIPDNWSPTKISEFKQSATPVPSPSLPDFSREKVKPRTVFDVILWKQFDDKDIGLRFRYPPEWGEPNKIYKYENSETVSGWMYILTFTNARFFAGGTSKDFFAARGGDLTDFNGFGVGENIHFWKTKHELCEESRLTFCKVIGNSVHIVSSSMWLEGYNVFGVGKRLLFIDRPGKKISGIVLGGPFYKESTLQWNDLWIDEAWKGYDEALLQRKLDAETMKNFDLIEKIFETVEIY